MTGETSWRRSGPSSGQAGVDARKEADILHRMWCKFMLNVGVNQVCMAYACGYGGVQAPARLGIP